MRAWSIRDAMSHSASKISSQGTVHTRERVSGGCHPSAATESDHSTTPM